MSNITKKKEQEESICCDACGNKEAPLPCEYCHRANVRYCSRECRSGLGWVKHEGECNVVRTEQLCATPYAWQNLAPHNAWEHKMQDEAIGADICNRFPSYLVKHDLPDQLTVKQTVIPAIRESKPIESEHSEEQRVKEHTFEVFVNGVSAVGKKPLSAPDAMISTHSSNAAAQRLVESRIARPQSRTYWIGTAAAAAVPIQLKLGDHNVIELVRNGDKEKARRVEFFMPENAVEDFSEQVQQRLGQGLKGFWQEQLRWKGLGKQQGISSHHAFNPEMGDGVVLTVDKELKLVDLEFYVARDPKPVRLQQQTFQKTVDDSDSTDIQALAMALEDILEENPRHEQAQLHLASLLDFFHNSQRSDDAATLTKGRVAIGEAMTTVGDELIGKRSSDEWDQWIRGATAQMVERRIEAFANRMAKLILQREDLEVEEAAREGFFRRTAARARAAAVRRQITVLQNDISKFETALGASGKFPDMVNKLNRVRMGNFQEDYPALFENRRRARGLSKKNIRSELEYQRRIELKIDSNNELIGKRNALEWEQLVFNADVGSIDTRVNSFANRLAKLILQRKDLENEEAARESWLRRTGARARAAMVRTQIRGVQDEIRLFSMALRSRLNMNLPKDQGLPRTSLSISLERLESMYSLAFRNEDWAQHYFTDRRATRGLKQKGVESSLGDFATTAPIGSFFQIPRTTNLVYFATNFQKDPDLQNNEQQQTNVVIEKLKTLHGIDVKEGEVYESALILPHLAKQKNTYLPWWRFVNNTWVWKGNEAEKDVQEAIKKIDFTAYEEEDPIRGGGTARPAQGGGGGGGEPVQGGGGGGAGPAQGGAGPAQSGDEAEFTKDLARYIERLKTDENYTQQNFRSDAAASRDQHGLSSEQATAIIDVYRDELNAAIQENKKLQRAARMLTVQQASDSIKNILQDWLDDKIDERTANQRFDDLLNDVDAANQAEVRNLWNAGKQDVARTLRANNAARALQNVIVTAKQALRDILEDTTITDAQTLLNKAVVVAKYRQQYISLGGNVADFNAETDSIYNAIVARAKLLEGGAVDELERIRTQAIVELTAIINNATEVKELEQRYSNYRTKLADAYRRAGGKLSDLDVVLQGVEKDYRERFQTLGGTPKVTPEPGGLYQTAKDAVSAAKDYLYSWVPSWSRRNPTAREKQETFERMRRIDPTLAPDVSTWNKIVTTIAGGGYENDPKKLESYLQKRHDQLAKAAFAKKVDTTRWENSRNLPHRPGFVPSHDPSRPPPGQRGNYY